MRSIRGIIGRGKSPGKPLNLVCGAKLHVNGPIRSSGQHLNK
jgi:hypothetical protein